MTEVVTIKADTVYLSREITISYNLNIEARVVLIDSPILMNMTRNQFLSKPHVEGWVVKEEFYNVGKVTMRRLEFGLINILHNINEIPESYENNVCQPEISSVEETGKNVSNWFDITAINLQYIYARTVLKEYKKSRLVEDIGKFNLGFTYNSAVVRKPRVYLAAQKYIHLLELNQEANVHNVPKLSIQTISQLSNVLFKTMKQYRENEHEQEIKLTLATGRVEEMFKEFKNIELQQQSYFDGEQEKLNAIFDSSSTSWNFSFVHRSIIENNIGNSISQIQAQNYDMQHQELNITFHQAQQSQHHITSVVQKLSEHQERLKLMLSSSSLIQTELQNKFNAQIEMLDQLMPGLQSELRVWQHNQEVKAFFDFVLQEVTLGVSVVGRKKRSLGFDERLSLPDEKKANKGKIYIAKLKLLLRSNFKS